MTNQQLWQAVLGELELNITKANFTTWFKNTAISSIEGERIVIGVPNTFTKAWLENKYHQSILKTLQKIVGGNVKEVIYKVEAIKPQMQKAEATSSRPAEASSSFATAPVSSSSTIAAPNRFGLNPKYTFTNFIVGKNNELAHAAAQAVAKSPGKSTYNPLFIYGGVGLGKTHLLQGIGHAILEADSKQKSSLHHERKIYQRLRPGN